MQSGALQQPKEAVQVNGDRAENESDDSESEDDSEDEEETTGKEMAEASQKDGRLASNPQVWIVSSSLPSPAGDILVLYIRKGKWQVVF